MANCRETCPECDNEIWVAVGQSVLRGTLVWFRSWYCKHCGFAVEEDGQDTPASIRETIMDSEGVWGYYVQEDQNKLDIYKTIRQELGVAMSEIKTLKMNGEGALFTGTHAEMRFWDEKLSENHISGTIMRMEDNSGQGQA